MSGKWREWLGQDRLPLVLVAALVAFAWMSLLSVLIAAALG